MHASDKLIEPQDWIADTCGVLLSRSRDLIGRAQARATRLKQERPLFLLGMAAGSAFVVGLCAGIWRSQHQ